MTNEERLRKSFADWNETGLSSVDGFWHPDIEYHESSNFPGAGTYRGIEAVRGRFAEYLEILGDVETRIERVTERGDRVAWAATFFGRTPEGLPYEHTWGYVGRFDDDLLIECRAFYEPADAFAALETEG